MAGGQRTSQTLEGVPGPGSRASLGKEQPPDCSSSDDSERSWMDDYDYVHLQVKIPDS